MPEPLYEVVNGARGSLWIAQLTDREQPAHETPGGRCACAGAPRPLRNVGELRKRGGRRLAEFDGASAGGGSRDEVAEGHEGGGALDLGLRRQPAQGGVLECLQPFDE